MSLSTTIKTIQDIMRKDDGVDGDAQRIAQLTWMLFLKILDQQENDLEQDARDNGARYRSPIPENCRWRNWGSGRVADPPSDHRELITFVNGTLFPSLKSLPSGDDPMRQVIKQVFEDLNNHMKSGALMLAVIEKLDTAIDFRDFKVRRNLGDIYEQVLSDLRSAGNAGEFYTPRPLTQIMVQFVGPQLIERERVLDPACGTGGFLTASIDYLRAQAHGENDLYEPRAEQLIAGIEKKQLPHLLCTTNLLLHGIAVPSQVQHDNTLARPWTSWGSKGVANCVITNPPFGGLEESSSGSDYPSELRTRETADLFLVLIVRKLLASKGRAAVVLPDGTLFGMGTKAKIKEMLLQECNLHTIVRLPHGVFAPYTSIKTNLLFFTKGEPTTTIWFYEHPYPEGRRSYSKTRPLTLDEFDPLVAWWGYEGDGFSGREENERAWRLDFAAEKETALNRAKPFWERATSTLQEATLLESRLPDSNGTRPKRHERQLTPDEEEVAKKIVALRAEARDAQAAGDRLYWQIYNLDLRNPHSPSEDLEDPDTVLSRHTNLLNDISDSQRKLRAELSTALAHLIDDNV
jgi:type I restriction enzyme M protein